MTFDCSFDNVTIMTSSSVMTSLAAVPYHQSSVTSRDGYSWLWRTEVPKSGTEAKKSSLVLTLTASGGGTNVGVVRSAYMPASATPAVAVLNSQQLRT